MKVTALFKSLTPYKVAEGADTLYTYLSSNGVNLDDEHDAFAPLISRDPEGSSEIDTIGFTKAHGMDSYVSDVLGSGVLMFVRHAKRTVPPSAIRARLADKVAAYEDVVGRKPGRSERRSMQEEAHGELLPRAFVRDTIVPVIFTPDGWLLVFTSVPARSDAVVTFISVALRELSQDVGLTNVQLNRELAAWMTSLALGSTNSFQATDFAVMKGEESASIRVTKRDIAFSEVQAAIKAGFRVEEVGLVHTNNEVFFRLNKSFTLSQVKFSGDKLLDIKENAVDASQEMLSITWLVISEYRQVLVDLIADINEGFEDEAEEEDY